MEGSKMVEIHRAEILNPEKVSILIVFNSLEPYLEVSTSFTPKDNIVQSRMKTVKFLIVIGIDLTNDLFFEIC